MAGEPAVKTEDNKQKRGAFPRVALEPVLELLDGIQELGHGDPVRRRTAFEHINRSPDSSTSYALNAAANSAYGVIKGGKNAQYLELTATGKRIAEAATSDDRLAAIHDVLFENEFFAALVDKYADRPQPQDSIAVDYLQREHGLSPADAETCWTVAKENVATFQLFEESGSKRVIISQSEARKRLDQAVGASSSTTEQEEISQKVAPSGDSKGMPDRPSKSGQIVPQITFNIQVVLPVDGTPEVYDAIFASMSEHLLGRGGI